MSLEQEVQNWKKELPPEAHIWSKDKLVNNWVLFIMNKGYDPNEVEEYSQKILRGESKADEDMADDTGFGWDFERGLYTVDDYKNKTQKYLDVKKRKDRGEPVIWSESANESVTSWWGGSGDTEFRRKALKEINASSDLDIDDYWELPQDIQDKLFIIYSEGFIEEANEDYIPDPYDKHFDWVASMDQDDYVCKHCGKMMMNRDGTNALHTAPESEIIEVVRQHLSTHGITEAKANEDYDDDTVLRALSTPDANTEGLPIHAQGVYWHCDLDDYKTYYMGTFANADPIKPHMRDSHGISSEAKANEVEHEKCPNCNFETSWKEGDPWQEDDAKDEMSRHIKNKHGESYSKEQEEEGWWECKNCNFIGKNTDDKTKHEYETGHDMYHASMQPVIPIFRYGEAFKEEEHPRDKGKFTSKGGGDTGKKEDKPKEKIFTMKQYERNEDVNNHDKNARLLVKQYGTPEELEEIDAILKRNPEGYSGVDGHADYERRYEISNKYYSNLVTDSEKPKAKEVEPSGMYGQYNILNEVEEEETQPWDLDPTFDEPDGMYGNYAPPSDELEEAKANEEQINASTYYYDYSDYWKKGDAYQRSGLTIQADIPTSWVDTEWDELPSDIQSKIRDAGYVTSYEAENNEEFDTALLIQLLNNELEEEEQGHDETEDIAIVANLLDRETSEEAEDFKEEEHPREDSGKFTSGGGDTGGKHSKTSTKDLIKSIKGGNKDWHAWGRTEKNEELYAEMERRNKEVPKPKSKLGDKVFRDAPDAVAKMEQKVKYWEDQKDYWNKITKFPSRDYQTPNQLGDAKWFMGSNISTNLRDAKKKLEGIKAQQGRGTDLIRKPTYKDGKKRFYYSEEPKGEPPEEPWQKGGEGYSDIVDILNEKKKKASEFEDSDRPVSPNTLQRYSEPIDLPTGKNALDQTYGVSEPETPDGQDLTGITVGQELTKEEIFGDSILPFADLITKKVMGEADAEYNRIRNLMDMGETPETPEDLDRWANEWGVSQELVEKVWIQEFGGKFEGDEKNILDFSDKNQEEIEQILADKPEDPYYKGEEEIIEKKPFKPTYLYYKQYPFGRRAGTPNPFGEAVPKVFQTFNSLQGATEAVAKEQVSLRTMDYARVWWDNQHPDRPWADMRIGDRQRAILAFLRDPSTSLEAKEQDIGYGGYSCPECGLVFGDGEQERSELAFHREEKHGVPVDPSDSFGYEGGTGSGRKKEYASKTRPDTGHIGWKNYGISDYIDKAEKEYLEGEEEYRRVIDEPRTGDDFNYGDWSQRREEELDTDEKARDYLEKIKYSIDQGGAKYQRGGEQLEDPTPWASLAQLAGTTVKDILFPSKEQAGGGGAGGAGGAGGNGAGGNGAVAPTGNGGEPPTNGDDNGEDEELPSRRIGFGYGRYRNCPKGQVYRNGKCVAEEGGKGSGKSGHQSWMISIEEDHTYDFCENCSMITEQVNRKCDMCGKKV